MTIRFKGKVYGVVCQTFNDIAHADEYCKANNPALLAKIYCEMSFRVAYYEQMIMPTLERFFSNTKAYYAIAVE
jgi:hypothetical protein